MKKLSDVNYTNLSKSINKNSNTFVETPELKAVVKYVVSGIMRKRVNNFFISTTSTIFKEQMAEYIKYEISKREKLMEYAVIVHDFPTEELSLDKEFQTVLESLISGGFTKIVIYIDDFDKKCKEVSYDEVFDFLKLQKENLGFEEIKLIATMSEEIKYDDYYYSNPELKYDSIELIEPEIDTFKNVLEHKIINLAEEHEIKFSDDMFKYFDLMYIAQNINTFSMCSYLDTIDTVFSIAKANNRKYVRRSDINEAFSIFKSTCFLVDEKVLKETCYHEAGHCVIAKTVFGEDYKLKALSCVPDSNGLLGSTVGHIKKMDYALDENILIQYLAYNLGGILGEEYIDVPINLGAEEDLEEVMDTVLEWLLKSGANSNVGKYCHYNQDKVSQKKLESIENEAEKLISKAAEYGKKVLAENEKFLCLLAEELFKKKLLSESDVNRIYKHSKK